MLISIQYRRNAQGRDNRRYKENFLLIQKPKHEIKLVSLQTGHYVLNVF